jgi:UDP-N-acetyl-D-glucosamine dehydrogenase
MSYILGGGEEIKKYARRGQLVILESTTYPGTTDEVLQPMIEEAGLKLNEDFLLAFRPNASIRAIRSFKRTTSRKSSAASDRIRTKSLLSLYAQYRRKRARRQLGAVAKRVNCGRNTFRAINIGMANEMAKVCNALNIDTWEVVRAAATKPFGFMAFYPGPGIGGHCIPLDPHYLSWKARQHGFDSQFITLAEQINSGMPKYVVELVRDALNGEQKAVNGSQILILGVAYKKDIDDMRESPALSVIDLLRAQGANVVYHDSFVPEVTFDHAYTIGDGEPLYNQELSDDLIKNSDCVVIARNIRASITTASAIWLR